ncbi:efflux transporter outer membrane subunit [Diaphorobacter aerolatus]|nr:efflux transporter outer membrane subunit [Diaphorobacter aerolatus]
MDRSTPAQWLQPAGNSGGVQGVQLGVDDLQQWWHRFNDPELNALVNEALNQNLDLVQALGRLKRQRSLMGVASSTYKPEMTGGARTLQDIAAVDSYFHASIDVAWDLGLFGAREATMQVAHGELLTAQAQARGASVNLVADVVHRWLDIRMAQRQRGLLEQRVALDERALKLTQVRLQQRLGSHDAVQEVQLQLGQSRAQFYGVKESQARAAHALAVLLGRTQPDGRWLATDVQARMPQPLAFQLQVLPADLLRTRPDIESAEAAVEHAAGTLGLSRSALYPRFALSGSLLYSYNLTRNFRTTSDQMPLIGPVIDIPLFDWGRRRSQVEADEAAFDIAVKGYRQSVLEGIADVETALAGIAAQHERIEALEDMAQQLAARGDVVKRRQRLGLASEFSGLADQRAALQNQSDQAIAQGAQALAYIALYKALGGAPLPAQANAETAQ